VIRRVTRRPCHDAKAAKSCGTGPARANQRKNPWGEKGNFSQSDLKNGLHGNRTKWVRFLPRTFKKSQKGNRGGKQWAAGTEFERRDSRLDAKSGKAAKRGIGFVGGKVGGRFLGLTCNSEMHPATIRGEKRGGVNRESGKNHRHRSLCPVLSPGRSKELTGREQIGRGRLGAHAGKKAAAGSKTVTRKSSTWSDSSEGNEIAYVLAKERNREGSGILGAKLTRREKRTGKAGK